jgi:hypothetical protein
LQVAQVLGLDRIGWVVGERAIQFAVENLEVERQLGEHARRDVAAHAVRRVGDDLQRSKHRLVDEADDVLRELGEQILALDGALCPGGRREALGRQPPDIAEARVLADGLRPSQAELDAVVLGRIVRRGEDRSRGFEATRCEVHEVGRGEPEVDDVDALVGDALGEGPGQLDTGRAHVATDEDRALLGIGGVCGGELSERGADGVGLRRIELVGHDAADVVGLEDLTEVVEGARIVGFGGHGAVSLVAGSRCPPARPPRHTPDYGACRRRSNDSSASSS